MLCESENERQREIGKQLMIINMVRDINENSPMSGITRTETAEWASMDINDVRKLCFFWKDFTWDELAWSAIHAYEHDGNRAGKNGELYMLRICMVYGNVALNISFCDYERDLVEKLACGAYSDYCAKHSDRPISEDIDKVAIFEKILSYYEKRFIEVLEEVIAEGYDWDVICELAGFDIPTKKYARYYEACLEKNKPAET